MVAAVYDKMLRRAEPGALSSVAECAAELAPTSCWPQVLAAVGLQITGDAAAAAECTQIARERGVPEIMCQCLRSVGDGLSGKANVAEEDLAALALPQAARVTIQLVRGIGPKSERIRAILYRGPLLRMGKAIIALPQP